MFWKCASFFGDILVEYAVPINFPVGNVLSILTIFPLDTCYLLTVFVVWVYVIYPVTIFRSDMPVIDFTFDLAAYVDDFPVEYVLKITQTIRPIAKQSNINDKV